MDAVEFFKEKERMCKKYVINGDACMYTNCPIARELHSCIDAEDTVEGVKKMVEIVENWAKNHPVFNLSEDQKTAIRGRIAEGFPWLVREGNEYDRVWFFENEPKLKKSGGIYTDGGQCSDVVSKVYDFVTFENSPLYLPDLLGGEE